MIRPSRVLLQNYRTWPLAEWVLPTSGVTLVRGRDLDTKTTSAVGKTSLLASLSYALGFGPPTTETTSWGTAGSSVKLALEFGSEQAEVIRGTDGLVLRIGTKKWSGRDAERELRQRLGNFSILVDLTWRKQRARGNFFSLRPAPRREFLTTLLDVESWEQKAEEARKEADSASKTIPAKEARCERARADLQRLGARPILPPIPDPGEIEQIERTISLLRSQDLSPPKEPEELGQLQTFRSANTAAWHELQMQLRAWDARVSDLRARVEGRCGACGQAVNRIAPEELATALKSLEDARTRIAENRSEAAEIEEAIRFFNAQHQEATSAWRANSAGRQKQLDDAYVKRTELLAAAGEHRSSKAILTRWESDNTRLQQELSQAENDLAASRRQANECQDLASLLRQFLGELFAEVLADLSETTNAILARIPNVSLCSIEFYTEEKGTKREVSERIFVGGVERGKEGLSGGQEAAFELAVDLALFDIVTARGVVRPTWMVLDEPFDGMGQPDREAFLEYLASKRDHLFLVIDHSREFSELFRENGIGIEKQNGISRIVSDDERATW